MARQDPKESRRQQESPRAEIREVLERESGAVVCEEDEMGSEKFGVCYSAGDSVYGDRSMHASQRSERDVTGPPLADPASLGTTRSRLK